MPRQVISPSTWRSAQKDFESGMKQADICRKYNIKASALGNRIKRDGWRLSQEQKAILSDFRKDSVKISEAYTKANDIQKKEIESEFTTILEDNYLIQNNRKLLKMAQGILIKNKDNFDHSNIRNLTGAVRDIESVANPQSNNINIKNTNAVQVQKIVREIVD